MSPASSNVVILHGNDEFLVDQTARKILGERCPQAEADGALSTIRGDVGTVDEAREAIKATLSAIQSLSMFSAQNVTWLREVTFLSGPVFKSDEVKSSVEHLQNAIAGGLGEEQFLLITVCGKVAKTTRFYKAVAKVAEIREFSKAEKPWEVEKEALGLLKEALSERGITAVPDALSLMSARIGGERRLLMQEVEKMDLYLGERRRMERADVACMVAAHQESHVFELSDCIGNRDLPRAMDLLARLESQGASPIAVMATLHNALREMGYLRALLAESAVRLDGNGRFGKLVFQEPAAQEGFQILIGDKKRSPFRLFALARQSQGFSLAQMDRMIRLSAETYARMFRSSFSQYELIRIMVLSMLFQSTSTKAS
jgi:DNA polymerase-3 subunit delta